VQVTTARPLPPFVGPTGSQLVGHPADEGGTRTASLYAFLDNSPSDIAMDAPRARPHAAEPQRLYRRGV
jgi:hypothetical protein